MAALHATLAYVLCHFVLTQGQDDEFLYGTFPPDFRWGTATSAYQIEGAWDADGKGESIWDRYTHEGKVVRNETGDVACNSYYQYMEDVAVIQAMQVNHYRFSMAWTRILPDGTLAGGINQPGIDYYNNLIDALLAAGVEPMVTLYHWDLPQALQDIGGWHNEELIGHFRDYADVCFQNFGDRVKLWITFNEPWVTCHLGYNTGIMAPGERQLDTGGYETAHVLLQAHAEAYHTYNDTYRSVQNGQISITLNSDWKEPATDDPLDIAAAERAIQFQLGWFGHPIYSPSGDYPQVMRDLVDAKSEAQGYPQSKLPVFTPQQVDRIRGTYDFFGLNHYTTYYVTDLPSQINCTTADCDKDVRQFKNASWPDSGSIWLKPVPWGFRKLLVWVDQEYGGVPIWVTENGVSDRNTTTDDDTRTTYYRDYINNALKAVNLDGVNMKAYTAWSALDNFEWRSGYEERFGLHYIDFENDPSLTRTPKDSSFDYTRIILDNGFPPPPPGNE